jgi:ATP adenylyltransferase/5',5'''-P-1,P-4-tetraphosphate phosphorylase II
MQKLKSAPRAFTLGVKAEIEKIFSICPQVSYKLLITKLWLCIGPKAQNKKDRYQRIWEANLQPW